MIEDCLDSDPGTSSVGEGPQASPFLWRSRAAPPSQTPVPSGPLVPERDSQGTEKVLGKMEATEGNGVSEQILVAFCHHVLMGIF